MNVLVVTDSPLGGILASALTGATACPVEVTHLRGADGTGRFERLAGRADCLVIAALETSDPVVLRGLNLVALAHGFAWIHAVLDGPVLFAGPTFIPGRTPCYECFLARVSVAIPGGGSYLEFKRALAEGRALLGDSGAPAPVHGLLCALASREAIDYLRTGSAVTVGKALAVNLPTMELTTHEVPHVPDCPACGPG
jgi:thiazole/oxazole-forming peptide maturase SagC family component